MLQVITPHTFVSSHLTFKSGVVSSSTFPQGSTGPVGWLLGGAGVGFFWITLSLKVPCLVQFLFWLIRFKLLSSVFTHSTSVARCIALSRYKLVGQLVGYGCKRQNLFKPPRLHALSDAINSGTNRDSLVNLLAYYITVILPLVLSSINSFSFFCWIVIW